MIAVCFLIYYRYLSSIYESFFFQTEEHERRGVQNLDWKKTHYLISRQCSFILIHTFLFVKAGFNNQGWRRPGRDFKTCLNFSVTIIWKIMVLLTSWFERGRVGAGMVVYITFLKQCLPRTGRCEVYVNSCDNLSGYLIAGWQESLIPKGGF